MRVHAITFSREREFPKGLSGFREDARAALEASPDYFVFWYTAKSIGLVVVAVGLAYALGRAHGRKVRRR